MITEPSIENRTEQPYVGIRARVAIPDIGTVLPPLHREVADWLENQGVAPAGAPFFRYLVINMESESEIEVGIPVASALSGNGRIQAGLLPAGHYATLTHTGEYPGLYDATRELLAWADKHGIQWQKSPSEHGEVWRARVEFYLNHDTEPDPTKRQAQLAFLVA